MSFGHKQVLYFKWNTPKFSNHISLYNHWQLENIWASLHGIFYGDSSSNGPILDDIIKPSVFMFN